MIKKALIFVIFATMILMIGCTTVPTVPLQAQRISAVIQAPKDQVWPLLVSEVDLHFTVQSIDKEVGLLTTQFVQMQVGYNNTGMERYVFPLGGYLATWAGFRMKMRIMAIESEPGKTKITIDAHYEAFDDKVSNSWIVARSNGSVENQILTSIEQKLR